MSSVAVIRRLLAADASLTALVPADRIFAGEVALNAPLPAIGISEVSASPRNTLSMGEPDRAAFSRAQVTVYTKTYPEKKQILDLVRQAVPNTRGFVGSTMVLSITPQGSGPDLDSTEDKIYTQSRDFRVSYIE